MAAASIITPDTLVRLKRSVQSALGLIVKVTVFIVIAVFGGLLSSWYVINNGASFNTERIGPWVKWTHSARLNSDPYSLVRQDRQSMLLYSSTFVSRYEAAFDSENRRLHSACHYAVEGPIPDSDWWNINVFDAGGRLISNRSNRYGFNAATIIPTTNSTFRVDLAREARAGNWIPTSRAGRLIIVLEFQNRTGDTFALGDDARSALPTIKRISCR